MRGKWLVLYSEKEVRFFKTTRAYKKNLGLNNNFDKDKNALKGLTEQAFLQAVRCKCLQHQLLSVELMQEVVKRTGVRLIVAKKFQVKLNLSPVDRPKLLLWTIAVSYSTYVDFSVCLFRFI